MARTSIPVVAAYGSYPTNPNTLGGLITAGVNGDNTNGNNCVSSGRDLIIAHNTDSSSHAVTIEGSPDTFNRIVNLICTIPAGEYAIIGPIERMGYVQPGNVLWIDAHNTIKLIVVSL